jgi:transposase-like protein
MFDDVSGSSETPWPYPVVIPSAVGSAILPFACPHCKASCDALVNPRRQLDYHDKLRKFCWCPSCKGRFFVDRVGEPLKETLPAGAAIAPSTVRALSSFTDTAQAALPKPRALVLLGALPIGGLLGNRFRA